MTKNIKKVSTAATLLHRALSLPNTTEGRNREIEKVYSALQSNGYPSKFIYDVQTKKSQSSTVPSPEELVGMFFKLVDPTMSRNSFASLPYIKGVTEPLTRVLKKHEITVVNKPLKMLQQEFPIPKSRPPLTLQPNIVYKIPCGNCSWSYISETGKSFATRKKEHIRNVNTAAKAPELLIMLGLMTMSLILTTRQSLTKAVLASESFWNLGTPRLHLMRTITLAHSQDNIAFLSTNILNVLFPNFIPLFPCFITLYIF